MNRIFLLFVLAASLTFRLSAQISYATMELQEIGDLLQRRGCILSSSGTFLLPQNSPFDFYEIRQNDKGDIVHLGIPFMSRKKVGKDFMAIYDFVERYILHFSLLSTNERERLLQDDKVTLTYSNISKLDTSCSITIASDKNGFHFQWMNDKGEEVCSMNFPKDVQLIFGKNKIEIERDFLNGLNLLPDEVKPVQNNLIDENVILSSDSVYWVYKGSQYIIREINSDTYYSKDENGRLIPLFNTKYPSETISNLLNSLLTENYSVNICQRLYGKGLLNYMVSYSKLYAYCTHLGCQPYVGIEAVSDDYVKAIVVFENEMFGYNHLLYVNIGLGVLKEKKGIINAELFCYIPTYNIKSLFQPNELNNYEK